MIKDKTSFNKKKVIASAAVLALSLIASIGLVSMAASSAVAYAQVAGSEPTVVGKSCVLNQPDPNTPATITFELWNLNTNNFHYVELLDPNGQLLSNILIPASIPENPIEIEYTHPASIQPGTEITIKLYEDVDSSGSVPEPDELIASDTVTCGSLPPLPLTEQFKNQGECIAHANAIPNSGITKEDCKEAFKV